jgi:hypothetical protein
MSVGHSSIYNLVIWYRTVELSQDFEYKLPIVLWLCAFAALR